MDFGWWSNTATEEPWCAITVGDDGITGKDFALCQDERKLIFDQKGAGTFCPFPFEFNGVRSVKNL